MKNNQKSWIGNLPTSTLLIRLEQYQEEYIQLKAKCLEGYLPLVEQRLKQIEDTVFFIKNLLTGRVLESAKSLQEIAQTLVSLEGDTRLSPMRRIVKKEIYQEAFVRRYLEYRDVIDYTLLYRTIELLDIDHLLKLVCYRQLHSIHPLIQAHLENCPLFVLEEAVERIELDELWEDFLKDKDSPLYEIARRSLEKRIFSDADEDIQEEVLAKIELDISEEKGKMYNGTKRKRKTK